MCTSVEGRTCVVDVTIKVILADLVGTEADGEGSSIDPNSTILRDIAASGGVVTQADALNVLSQLPAVEGLTPAYTPQNVVFIRLAKLVKSLIPFNLG